ncbi:unnamed protein product [Ectocarpus sp. 4 AP-2014]|uniref:EsV-1-4 n=1 Tax=Ectocarpus siliculosus virus 1 (isolate New Zealand/Kaikoura/1988) TaxID=654926 RepID=Q8QNQ5_ESV1K|nr:EsV-1-4 [Ectocarpus siliculosus virus 1]AAK14430.1 EsV-1-4 [Ectocarpus siliculosus virus 1]
MEIYWLSKRSTFHEITLVVITMHKMDPLTARLMSRSGLSAAGRPPAHSTPMAKAGIGLNPSKPLLPPVHNLRMIYLKEPFGDAEIHLHDARVALKSVQNGGPTAPLYAAMAKLEVAERDYFARRYFDGDKAILKGWNAEKFKQKIEELINTAANKLTAITVPGTTNTQPGYHISARGAAISAANASSRLNNMNDKWYFSIGGNRLPTKPSTFSTDLTALERAIKTIKNHLRVVLTLPDSDTTKQASLTSIKASLRHAEICQRLARLVEDDRCDLPDDV